MLDNDQAVKDPLSYTGTTTVSLNQAQVHSLQHLLSVLGSHTEQPLLQQQINRLCTAFNVGDNNQINDLTQILAVMGQYLPSV